MIPVIIIAIAWWAGSGVVATIKAARASEPAPAADSMRSGGASSKSAKAPNAAASKGSPTTKTGPALGPGDVTFGQWQRSLYRRMQRRFRNRLPGQRGGKRVRDLIGDITAASVAGAVIFGMGFASGTTWAASRRSARRVRTKTQGTAAGPGRGSGAGAGPGRRGPRRQPPGAPTPGPGAGPNRGGTPNSNTPPGPNPNPGTDDEPIEAELLDDTETPAPPNSTSQYDSTEYADLVGQPELLAHYPEPRSGDPMSEILNIHHLFDFSKKTIVIATEHAEQAGIRANSAGERAEQASNRSITAGNRAESAGLVAADATAQATQLEETAARFSGLNMDSASLASIASAIEGANAVAAAERRRAEAEDHVADCAAALAAAEDAAAAAAAESAKASIGYVEQVKYMHDTVQAHQMPHAEAQVLTGNAAAHESVLAAN